jgi:predicted AlkP superfamily phosphohydrolase/phosphomutase
MEWTLVLDWAERGKLPAFRRLFEEGVRMELASTAAQLPDTVWPAIYAGANPGRLAKYFYAQYDAAKGDLRMLSDDAIGASPFWKILSEAGRRVCVVDIPKSPVIGPINGISIVNWGSHGSRSAYAAHPPDLLKETGSRFGRHPVGHCDAGGDDTKSLLELRRRLLAGVQLRGELCRYLMQREDWDVFFTGFSEAHCAGHHFWHLLDATHPRHDPADTDGLRDTIESIYRAVDQQVGELVDLAGSETRCLVFSGHGMGPIWHASWNLQEILDRLGFGKPGVNAAPGREQTGARVNPWRLLKMKVPGRLQYAVKAMLPQRLQNELVFRWYAGARNWAGCRAIAVPNNDSTGAIRILVKGRDRHGVVAPGHEYRKTCESIAAALGELVDPPTGRKVARQVTLTYEEFEGRFLDRLPDLTVLWDQRFAWDEVASPLIGNLKIRRQDSRSGSHTPYGFLLARGYGASPGVTGPQATIYDIAPTVLQAAEVNMPDMDGRSLFY